MADPLSQLLARLRDPFQLARRRDGHAHLPSLLQRRSRVLLQPAHLGRVRVRLVPRGLRPLARRRRVVARADGLRDVPERARRRRALRRDVLRGLLVRRELHRDDGLRGDVQRGVQDVLAPVLGGADDRV